jgi:putative SOS response-associated peptidase YedK
LEIRSPQSYIARMCGRVIQSSGPLRYAIVDGLDMRDSRLSNYPRRWNGAPSQEFLVVRQNHRTVERSLDLLRWGLTRRAAESQSMPRPKRWPACPHSGKPIISADALRITNDQARQVALCDRDEESLAVGIAGLWENWKDPATGEWVRTFAIVTTPANNLVARIHERNVDAR